jgi:hypothetical protein
VSVAPQQTCKFNSEVHYSTVVIVKADTAIHISISTAVFGKQNTYHLLRTCYLTHCIAHTAEDVLVWRRHEQRPPTPILRRRSKELQRMVDAL